jgi:hypothetical protein
MTRKKKIVNGRSGSCMNNENIAKLLANLESGLTRTDACVMAGINKSTFYEHLKKYPDFAQSVEYAEIKMKKTCLDTIAKAGQSAWTACAWLLERKFGNEFRLKTEVTNNISGEVNVKSESIVTMKQIINNMGEKERNAILDAIATVCKN